MEELLKTRRCIRKYKPQQVSDADLDAVLEAGLYAPSGMNAQKTVMVAVRDKQTRDQLSRMNAAVMGSTADPFYGAPCVIVVLSSPERYTWLEDGSLVNIEIQKQGYAFPAERISCYSADLLLRQYARLRGTGKHFTYRDIKKVYVIVLIEESPAVFHK